jgi:uncharacterized membrane protein YsdA (DUF1294 family)
MYPRSSAQERVFAVGTLLLFLGLGGLAFFDLHGALRTISGFCLVLGFVLHTGAFFVRVWDRSRAIRRVKQNPDGVLWLRILVIGLWLGILPLVSLWAYQHVHRP